MGLGAVVLLYLEAGAGMCNLGDIGWGDRKSCGVCEYGYTADHEAGNRSTEGDCPSAWSDAYRSIHIRGVS